MPFEHKLFLLTDTAPFSGWKLEFPIKVESNRPSISFKLFSIGERKHSNSEGWEKYEIIHILNCHKEYLNQNEAHLDFSSLYKKLINANSYIDFHNLFEQEKIFCDNVEKDERLIDWY